MRWRRESATAAFVALGAALISFDTLPAVDALFATLLAALIAAAAVHDLLSYRLPDPINAAIFALGLVFAVIDAELPAIADDLIAAILRAAIVAALLWLLRAGHAYLRGRTGLGLGDVKLAAAGAVWLPLEQLAMAILLASLSALLAAGWQRLTARAGGGESEMMIPFGAFLGPALWAVWYMARLGVLPG